MCKLLLFHTEMSSAKFLWGNVLLGGELQMDVKNSNLRIYDSAIYMKYGNMPLILNFTATLTNLVFIKLLSILPFEIFQAQQGDNKIPSQICFYSPSRSYLAVNITREEGLEHILSGLAESCSQSGLNRGALRSYLRTCVPHDHER